MMRVLITGAGSYVGSSFANWLSKWPDKYTVDTIDMRDPAWQETSFAGYDAVFHVAGIVHRPDAPEDLYYRVNRDLAVAVAGKAKREGVKRLIHMSTASVYGLEGKAGRHSEIGADTPPNPNTPYGKSKYEADVLLMDLQGEGFSVCLVRPPMIFGANCPGNYGRLRRLALRACCVPALANTRSMIYIGNFCEYVRLLLHSGEAGVFCPQDAEPYCTAELMRWIAEENGRKLGQGKLLAVAVRCLAPVLPPLRKAFGNLTYAPALSVVPQGDYCLWSPREAVKATEVGWGEGQ